MRLIHFLLVKTDEKEVLVQNWSICNLCLRIVVGKMRTYKVEWISASYCHRYSRSNDVDRTDRDK